MSENLKKELEYASSKEQEWRIHCYSLDHGGLHTDMTPEWYSAVRIKVAYLELSTALREHQKAGFGKH
jgi:hypothetical protein